MDVILVPTSLVVMFGYHLFLLYRILRRPETTVVGYENHNKMEWVERMMQVGCNLSFFSFLFLEFQSF